MFVKLINRLKEPSTYAGLAGLLFGAGTLFKDDNLPVIADAVQTGGETYIATGSPATAVGAVVMGLLAIFMPERKK